MEPDIFFCNVTRFGGSLLLLRQESSRERLVTQPRKQTNKQKKKQQLHAVSVEGNEINHLSMDVSARGTLLYKEREGIESTCGEW